MTKSFRQMFSPAKITPQELAMILDKFPCLKGNNQKLVLSWFMVNSSQIPPEIVVGKYDRSDRSVHLPKPVIWFGKKMIGRKLTLQSSCVSEIPVISLSSTVTNISHYLKGVGLPYLMWFECKTGNKLHKKVVQSSNQIILFKIGLVDRHFPLKPKDLD